MSAIEPPDNLLEIRNATMRVSRIESNTQTMTANLEVGTTLAVSGNTTLSSNLVVGGNVQVGTANLFVDTVSSNVGVGTNLHLAKLDVKGDIGLVGNIYSDSNLSVQYTTENPSNTWAQVGGDLNGEAADDRFGQSVALSSDGTRLAVGCHQNDGTGSNAGHVRVFNWSGSAWIQLGGDIDGEAANDYFGVSVALSSDGTRLAVGGYANDGTGSNAGHVRVFDLVGGTWTQVGGDIDGEAAGDFFGWRIALSSDGTRLAVTASATGSNAGRMRVFDLVGGVWTQIGGDLDGVAAQDYFGQSVALSSDGTRLAVGGPLNDSPDTDAGQVRVFDYDGVLKTKQIIKEDIVEIPGDLRAGCPVFFQAAATGSTINATQLIPYNNVLNNKGGGYNPSTRLFTAPIAGFYHFSFYHMSHSLQTEGIFTLNGTYVKAGGTPIRVHSNTGGAHSPASASLNVYMNASDTMGISLTSGNMYMGTSQYAGFNGFYLSS